ncbi:MAG: UDP-N-acetylmuramate--L-alanine ligase [Alphaproteobacteria bacterium]|nr:UDP-N-acetylmuramate--L-alanine ligase [Alphaproteobacteria bacterium]OJV15987.1 MAG: UDP-N-acetylmuramate--L-alanine ligase [Alphaproteobacteria bacterium 33-17]
MFLMSRNLISSRFGIVHFIGIGGIGMSGIAEILHNLGCNVQGSDLNLNAQAKRLEDLGMKIMIGHTAENVKGASVVVRSSAVKMDNPEIVEARKLGIPIIQRAEMLAELMRFKFSVSVAGTHGKTTTTSLVACLFEAENLSPTVINGGIINSKLTNAYVGESDYLIAEADESDGSFMKLPTSIAIVTNINEDHMDFYKSIDDIYQAFKVYVENIPFYGFAVVCKDHPLSAKLAEDVVDRKVLTYAIENQADIRATNIRMQESGYLFDVEVSNKVKGGGKVIKDCYIPMLGMHNILNSLAAMAIGIELGFKEQTIQNGFRSFQGVKRRFTLTGEVEGVRVYDDYAHHPEEIRATVEIARSVAEGTKGKVIGVFQPHRYTRLKKLFSDFVKAFDRVDVLVIADIYSAGEQPIENVSKDILIEAIRQHNNKLSIISMDSQEKLPEIISANSAKGDVVLCMGAGNITTWANNLPNQLRNAKVS